MIAAPPRAPLPRPARHPAGATQASPLRVWAAPAALLLLAFALRVYQLSSQSLWIDEAFSADRALLGPWLAAVGDEVHPPLYYLLLSLWVAVAGAGEFALRYLSLLAGAATVALAYRAGREWRASAGRLAALLVALSALAVYYSQEARMYALSGFFVLASLYGAWRFIHRGGRWDAVLYLAATSLLLYTSFFGWIVLAAENVFALWAIARGGLARGRWLRAQWRLCLYTLFCLPFLLRLFLTGPSRPRVAPPAIADLLTVPERFLFGPNPSLAFLPASLALLALALAWAAAPRRQAGHRPYAAWLPYWLALPAGLLLFGWLTTALTGLDLFQTRYASLALPALAVGAGSALARLPRTPRTFLMSGLAALCALALLAIYHDPALRRDDWRALAAMVQREERPGDLVVADQGWSLHPFLYYYRGGAPSLGIPLDVDTRTLQFPPPPPPTTPWTERLEDRLAGRDRVWYLRFLPAAFRDPGAAAAWFGGHGLRPVDEGRITSMAWTLYARRP